MQQQVCSSLISLTFSIKMILSIESSVVERVNTMGMSNLWIKATAVTMRVVTRQPWPNRKVELGAKADIAGRRPFQHLHEKARRFYSIGLHNPLLKGNNQSGSVLFSQLASVLPRSKQWTKEKFLEHYISALLESKHISLPEKCTGPTTDLQVTTPAPTVSLFFSQPHNVPSEILWICCS